MAFVITVELQMTVQDEAQAEKIFEAVYSGLAETAIKDRVLFGGSAYHSAEQSTVTSAAKAADVSKQLKPVEVHTPKKQVTLPAEEKPKERQRGILGRRQINRTRRD